MEATQAVLAAIVDSCQDAIYSGDMAGIILTWNAGAERLFGFTASEMIGQSVGRLYPAGHNAELQDILAAVHAGEGPTHLQRTRQRKDGSLVQVAVTISPIWNASGTVIGASSIARDITETNRAAEALQASEAFYRTIFDNTADCIFILDVTSDLRFKVVSFNPAEERAVGMTSAQVAGRFIEEILPRHVADKVNSHYTACVNERRTLRYDETLDLPRGKVPFLTTLIPLAAPDGRIHRIIGVASDLSERVRAEASAARESQRYELFLRNASDGIHILDPDGNVLEVSDAFCEMLGYSREELLGANVSLWDAQWSPDELRHRIATQIAAGHRSMFETTHRRRDGTTRDVEVTDQPLELDGQPVLFNSARDITERKRAQQALRENEARYRILFSKAPVGILYVSPADGTILSVNEAFAAMHGYSVEEMTSMRIVDLDTPDAARQVPGRFARTAAGETLLFETEHYHKDGHVVPLEVVSSAVVVGGERLIQAFHTDITNRRQVERALRTSEARSRTITQSANDAIVTADSAGNVVGWNRSAEKMFGYTETDITGQSISRLMPARFRNGNLTELRRILGDGESKGIGRTVELTGLHKDGTEFSLDLSLAVWQVAGDQFITGIIRDITARKASDALLRLEGAALEAAANAIVITDSSGVIEWANAAFTTFTGYPTAEAIGRKPGDLLKSGAHDRGFYQKLWDTIMVGGVWQGEVVNRRKDGSLYTEDMTITCVKDEHGQITHFIAVKQDISDRKQMEEQFRQAQKMESIGRLAGGVAHDFNNILMVIQAAAEFLLADLAPDDHRRVDAVQIADAAQRAATLTRQLLAFSRRQVFELQVLDLNTVVRPLEPMLRRVLEANIDLSLELGADLDAIKADPSQLDQVMLNLVVNARDAMPDGGRLVITTANVTGTEAPSRGHARAWAGPGVVLSITDTGVGMDAATRSRIFEPFFTTKPVGHGTGLGLATAYGIVEQLGGDIQVSTDVGLGTTFEIYFPRYAGPDHQSQPVTAQHLQATTRGARILLVEDDAAVRRAVRRLLERDHFVVTDVGTGDEALVRIRNAPDSVDLVLSDIMMPGITGLELRQRLRELGATVPVLLMSGYSEESVGGIGTADDLGSHIKKPFTADELAIKIEEVLKAGRTGA